MRGCLHAMLIVAAIPFALFAATVMSRAFSPGGIWSSEPPDYAEDALAYCAVGVVKLRALGFPGADLTGPPEIKTHGRRASFTCAADTLRGQVIIQVRAVCGAELEPGCAAIEAIHDARGRLLYLQPYEEPAQAPPPTGRAGRIVND